VLAALRKSAYPGALAALKEIYNAEDIDKAQVAVKAFELDYGAKYRKAVAMITDDLDVLLEFYKYPAEHWIHLHITNPTNPPLPPCGCVSMSPRPGITRPELPCPQDS
jgi:putative transposase